MIGIPKMVRLVTSEDKDLAAPQILLTDEWVAWLAKKMDITQEEAQALGNTWLYNAVADLQSDYLVANGWSCREQAYSSKHTDAPDTRQLGVNVCGESVQKRLTGVEYDFNKFVLDRVKNATAKSAELIIPNASPGLPGFFYYPTPEQCLEGLEELTNEQRFELLENQGNYVVSFYKDDPAYLGDLLVACANSRIPTHRVPVTPIPDYGSVPMSFLETREALVETPHGSKEKPSTIEDVEKDNLLKILLHMTSKDNVWEPESYCDRTITKGLGVEANLKYRYTHGSAYLYGWISDWKFRLYYSYLRGFQVYHLPIALKWGVENIMPKTFRPEDAQGVYDHINEIVGR